MTMKAGDVRICPSCEARNKPKWEFCVRCGESLVDVPLSASPVSAPLASSLPVERARAGMFTGFGWGSVAGLVGLCAAAALVAYRPTVEKTDPSVFAFPRNVEEPTPPPVTAPAQTSPNQDLLNRGRSLLVQRSPQAALVFLAQAVADRPDDPEARYAYAQALWQTDNRAEALTQYQEAARLAPNNVAYKRDLAKCLAALGQRGEAVLAYEAALALQPNSPAWLRELAGLQSQEGRSKEAVSLLTRASAFKPDDSGLQQELARALEAAGDAEAASAAYRRSLQIDPQAAASRALLANLLFRQGQKDEALSLVREGIALDPKVAGLHRDLGSLLERQGRLHDAVVAYREYVSRAASAPDAEAIAERARRLEIRANVSS